MQHTRLLKNGATAEGSGALLVAGDCSPHGVSQGDGDRIPTDETRAHAQALKAKPAGAVRSPLRELQGILRLRSSSLPNLQVRRASPCRGSGNRIAK